MVVGLLFFSIFFKHSMLVSRVCLNLYILIALQHGGNSMQIILINEWQSNILNKEQEVYRCLFLLFILVLLQPLLSLTEKTVVNHTSFR